MLLNARRPALDTPLHPILVGHDFPSGPDAIAEGDVALLPLTEWEWSSAATSAQKATLTDQGEVVQLVANYHSTAATNAPVASHAGIVESGIAASRNALGRQLKDDSKKTMVKVQISPLHGALQQGTSGISVMQSCAPCPPRIARTAALATHTHLSLKPVSARAAGQSAPT